MENLMQLKNIVFAELNDNPETRKSDAKLIVGCFKRMGIDVSSSFENLADNGQLKQMESITRCRRKLQQEHPELRDVKVAEFRADNEQKFKNFSKVSGI